MKWPYILIKYFYGNIQWGDTLSRAESSPRQRSPTSRTSWTTSDLWTTGWRPLVQMTFLLLVVGCISPSPIWAVDFAVESVLCSTEQPLYPSALGTRALLLMEGLRADVEVRRVRNDVPFI